MTEQQVRALRDRVFAETISDSEWKTAGPNWMKPENIEWLKQQALANAARAAQLPSTEPFQ